MSVLGTLAKRTSIENADIPISAASIAQLFPSGQPSLAGVQVSERRAYGLTAYFRAIALTAGTLATLPMDVKRKSDKQIVPVSTVLDNPNPRQTPFEFWFTTYANAISWGNAFGRKLRDGAGVVRQVWPLHPTRVTIELVDPSDAVPDGKTYWVRNSENGTNDRYTSYDIFHLPYLSPWGVAGLSPLQLAKQVLGINIATEDTTARFYGRGARLSGILSSKQKLDETRADRLKARWRQKIAGPGGDGDIAVLDADTTYQPISIPPQDAQLLESRKFGVLEIARLVGCPPHLLMDVEKSTSWGTGILEQVTGWVKFTLNSWVCLTEQRATRELLPGGWYGGSWYSEYDLEGLLRGDALTRAAFYASGIVAGWMSRNEARVAENKQPVEGLDEMIVPSNTALIINGSPQPVVPPTGNEPAGSGGSSEESTSA